MFFKFWRMTSNSRGTSQDTGCFIILRSLFGESTQGFSLISYKGCKNLSSGCSLAAFYIIPFSIVDTNPDGIITVLAIYSASNAEPEWN